MPLDKRHHADAPAMPSILSASPKAAVVLPCRHGVDDEKDIFDRLAGDSASCTCCAGHLGAVASASARNVLASITSPFSGCPQPAKHRVGRRRHMLLNRPASSRKRRPAHCRARAWPHLVGDENHGPAGATGHPPAPALGFEVMPGSMWLVATASGKDQNRPHPAATQPARRQGRRRLDGFPPLSPGGRGDGPMRAAISASWACAVAI